MPVTDLSRSLISRSASIALVGLAAACLAAQCGCRQEAQFTTPSVLSWWAKTGEARAAARLAPVDAEAQRKWLAAATGVAQKTEIEALGDPREAALLEQTILTETQAATRGLAAATPQDPQSRIMVAWATAATAARFPDLSTAWASVAVPALDEAKAAVELARNDPGFVKSAADLKLYLYARLPDLVHPSAGGGVVGRIWSAPDGSPAPESDPPADVVAWRQQMRTELLDFYGKAGPGNALSSWPHLSQAWLYDLDPTAVAGFGAKTTSGDDRSRAIAEWGEAGGLYERNVYLQLIRAVRMAEAAQDAARQQAGLQPTAPLSDELAMRGAAAAVSPLVAAARCSRLDLPRLATPRAFGQAWQDAAGVQGLLGSPRFVSGVQHLAKGQSLLAAKRAVEGRLDVAQYLLDGGLKWSQAMLVSDGAERLTTLAGADAVRTFAEAVQGLAPRYATLQPLVATAQAAATEADHKRAQALAVYGGATPGR